MNKKILIVEDDLFLGKLAVKKLEKENFEVSFLRSGVSVLTQAKADHPDAIVLDLIMPEKDGFQALEELKKDDETKNIPVIVLTALSSDEDREKTKKLGAKKYFIKSNIELSDLTNYLKEMLG